MLVAVAGVLSKLSESIPVVLVVDDLQWMDRPSWDVVLFALRRMRPMARPVALVSTWRSDIGDDNVIEDLFAIAGTVDLMVERLSDQHTGELIIHVAPSLSDADLTRLVGLAAGVALFAVELARHGVGPGGDLPASIDGSFGRRLRGLSPALRTAIGLCVFTSERTVAVLTSCIGDEFVGGALDELAEADLASALGHRVVLRHPFVAASVESRTGPSERRRLHQLLAGAATSATSRAFHLRELHAPPHAATAFAMKGGG